MNIIDNILLVADPNDLLALYLTDEDIKKRLNNKVLLDKLNKKYKVVAPNFITFFKKVNIHKIEPKVLYLYQQELHFPLTVPKIDERERVALLTWLYNAHLGNHYVFGLAVSLIDYHKKYTREYAVTCAYIASYMLNEYVDRDFFCKTANITTTRLKELQIHLSGQFIIPSTVFFTHSDLAILSYFSNDICQYRPSLIAETIHYLTTGKYKIYTLSEIAGPCIILKNCIDKMKLSVGELGSIAKKYSDVMPCAIPNDIIYQLLKKNKVTWHIKDFEKLEPIGQGVEADVYKLKHKNEKHYALKVVAIKEPAFMEIAILQLLKNKYIIDLLNVKIDTKVNLYLEYGQYSLKQGLKRDMLKKPMEVYFKQLIYALHHCHYNDIIHRDLKPDNVLYNGENLILIDFGLSVSYASLRNYLDPSLQASLNFRSPECLLGDTNYNYKSDIWSLGLMFYYMIQQVYFDNSLKHIFDVFGTPTDITWPKHKQLPKYGNYVERKGDISMLKNQTNQYYKYIKPCLILNPKKRADTSTLLKLY